MTFMCISQFSNFFSFFLNMWWKTNFGHFLTIFTVLVTYRLTCHMFFCYFFHFLTNFKIRYLSHFVNKYTFWTGKHLTYNNRTFWPFHALFLHQTKFSKKWHELLTFLTISLKYDIRIFSWFFAKITYYTQQYKIKKPKGVEF
jgi:hypothetical protein